MNLTTCCITFAMLTIIAFHGVSAGNHTWMCFVQYENGTVDYSASKMCSDGEYCCGKSRLECCRDGEAIDEEGDADSRWDDPYWVTRLAARISLLILAIGSAIGYCYKKCSCAQEPEHLVFVNHSSDASDAFGPADNYKYQPYSSAGAGQVPAYAHPSVHTATHTGNAGPSVAQLGAVNSFNPFTTNARKTPNDPQHPSATPPNAPAPHEDGSSSDKHVANFI